MSREIKFEYGFESVNGIIKKVYSLSEIPNIKEKCDVWNVLPIKYVRQFTGVMHRDIARYKNNEFDKEGNCFRHPVYDGDIVEFKSDPSFYINAKLGDRYIIEHYGAGFFMKPMSWGMKKLNAQNYVNLLPPYQTSNMANHYEVIGNIYENQELLTTI